MPDALTKDAILAADDVEIRAVDVPAWGGTVYVRSMDNEAGEAWEKKMAEAAEEDEERDSAHVKASLLVHTLCDANGNLLFTEDDVDALAGKSYAALNKCALAALRVNSLTDTDIGKMAKN